MLLVAVAVNGQFDALTIRPQLRCVTGSARGQVVGGLYVRFNAAPVDGACTGTITNVSATFDGANGSPYYQIAGCVPWHYFYGSHDDKVEFNHLPAATTHLLGVWTTGRFLNITKTVPFSIVPNVQPVVDESSVRLRLSTTAITKFTGATFVCAIVETTASTAIATNTRTVKGVKTCDTDSGIVLNGKYTGYKTVMLDRDTDVANVIALSSIIGVAMIAGAVFPLFYAKKGGAAGFLDQA